MLKLNANLPELMLFTTKTTKHLQYVPTSVIVVMLNILSNEVKTLGFALRCQHNTNEYVFSTV